MKTIKALTNFTWKGIDGNFLIIKGEEIEVDNVAFKELVKEKGLCVLVEKQND
jgi:hypothetical protein